MVEPLRGLLCFSGPCGGASEGFSLCFQGSVVEPLRYIVCVFFRAVW